MARKWRQRAWLATSALLGTLLFSSPSLAGDLLSRVSSFGMGERTFYSLLLPEKEQRQALCDACPGGYRGITEVRGREMLTLQLASCNLLMTDNEPDPDVYFSLGRIWYVVNRFGIASAYFGRGADAGSAKAMTAYAYVNGTYFRDWETRLVSWQQAAARGDVFAQAELGRFHAGMGHGHGQDTERDYALGERLIEEASGEGYPVADYYYAEMLYFGSDDPGMRDKATDYYRSAAKGGVRGAHEQLEWMSEPVPERPANDRELFYYRWSSEDRRAVLRGCPDLRGLNR